MRFGDRPDSDSPLFRNREDFGLACHISSHSL